MQKGVFQRTEYSEENQVMRHKRKTFDWSFTTRLSLVSSAGANNNFASFQ